MSSPRLLVVGLNYAPERTGIAPYTAGMAKGLARDFEVEVVTVHPHYPEWRIADGYGEWLRRERIDDVSVARVRHYVPKHPTGISRILSEASYAARVLTTGCTRPDAIIAVTPALMPVASALALGQRWSAPVGVVVQDLYSKAFTELKLLGGRLDNSVSRLERALLRRADGVVAIHARMADVISRDYGIAKKNVTVIPNWAHVEPPAGDRNERRAELGWDDDRTTIVHAGSMGAKQGLEHLLPAVRLSEERGLPLRFVLIGNGGARPELERAAEGLCSIEFLDALPEHQFMATLSAADLLLMHERPGMREMCVPSKLTTYFAAGRPVLAVTEPESAAAFEVQQSGAGVVSPPAAYAALIQAALQLRGADQAALGRSGTEYARHTLDRDAALVAYRSWVDSLLSGKR